MNHMNAWEHGKRQRHVVKATFTEEAESGLEIHHFTLWGEMHGILRSVR